MIVAGPESEGKTGFALSLALALAQQHANVAVYSGEMTRTQLVTRLLGMRTGIAVSRLHSGALRDAEIADVAESMGYLETLPLYIDTPATLTLDALNTGALSLHMNKPIDLLVVDSFHLIIGRNSGYWKADATEIVLGEAEKTNHPRI